MLHAKMNVSIVSMYSKSHTTLNKNIKMDVKIFIV